MVKKKIKILNWGVKLAWRIDKKMLIAVCGCYAILATMPAVILVFYQNVLSILSSFLNFGISNQKDMVVSLLILGVLFLISGLSARLNDDYLYMTMYDSFYLGLEEKMMEVAQKIDIKEFSKKNVCDEFYAAVSRCGSLTDLASSICSLTGKCIALISLLIVVAHVSPFIFGFMILYIILVIYLNSLMSSKMRTVWNEIREYLRKANYYKMLVRTGDTAKETRIFKLGNMIKTEWEQARDSADSMEISRVKESCRLNSYCKIGFYIFLALSILFSITKMGNGKITPETIIMLYMLCISIAEVTSKLPAIYQRFDYGLYGLELQKNIFDKISFIDSCEDSKKEDTPLCPEICFEANNLCFSYPNGISVLNNISFKINKGEVVALVGANGSGKTTLLKILLGLFKQEEGELKFQGRRYGEYKNGYISRQIGAFFQDFVLFHMTVQENIGIGDVSHITDDGMVWEALEKGGAGALVRSWKLGIKQMLLKNVDKNGFILSGGEGQRIAVSRTHMCNKPILVFDEPASMLDPIAELQQFQFIKEKVDGQTAILVSHRVGFAKLANRIMVLDNGRIIEDGTHKELIKKNGIYAKMFEKQAQWYNLDVDKTVAE